MNDKNILGLNDCQKNIFRAIFNRPKTKEELSEIIGCNIKTISNNLPQLKLLVEKSENYSFIKNFNENSESIFSIVEKRDFTIKIKPKIFSWNRSVEHPYIVFNLPDPPKGYSCWEIWPIGDTHYGSDSCDMRELNKVVSEIEERPNVLVILMGDLIENASKESPGESVYKQVFPPQEQKERFANLFAKISDRILYVVRGNHGFRSVKGCFLDPERDIANCLHSEYFEGAVYVDIICQNQKWSIMSFHGNGSSSTPQGRLGLVSKKANFHSANIYTMGHVHDQNIMIDHEILKNPIKLTLEIKKRYYVICGTFQKYWNSYAEQWVLQPNKIGCPKIILYCLNSEKPGDYHCLVNN